VRRCVAALLSVIAAENLDDLDASRLREMVVRLQAEVLHKQTLVDKLTHENAVLKRLKFAAQSERFAGEQRSLLEETLDTDLQAVSDEVEKLQAQDTPADSDRSAAA
jgi:transposase